MTNPTNPSRVSPGRPTGGQFSATQRGESDVDLGAPASTDATTEAAKQAAANERGEKLQDALMSTNWAVQPEAEIEGDKATYYLNSTFRQITAEVGDGEWAVYDRDAPGDAILEGTYDKATSDGISEVAKEIVDAGPDEDVPINDGEFFDDNWAREDDQNVAGSAQL